LAFPIHINMIWWTSNFLTTFHKWRQNSRLHVVWKVQNTIDRYTSACVVSMHKINNNNTDTITINDNNNITCLYLVGYHKMEIPKILIPASLDWCMNLGRFQPPRWHTQIAKLCRYDGWQTWNTTNIQSSGGGGCCCCCCCCCLIFCPHKCTSPIILGQVDLSNYA
jgi:hypothetical protein